jgi:hypothetical protein
MADPGINRDMQDMATHTQARVPALPMPVHVLAVDDQAAIMAVVAVDIPAAVVVDDPAAVKVAGITVTEHPLSTKGHSAGWPFLRPASSAVWSCFTSGTILRRAD